MTNDTITIRIQRVETSFGTYARLWKGNRYEQVYARFLLDKMEELNRVYNACGMVVIFELM